MTATPTITRNCDCCGRPFSQYQSLRLRTECGPCADLRAEYASEAREYERERADERWERA